MVFVISVLVSLITFSLVVFLLLKVRTPRYKVTVESVQSLLEQVLIGQAHSNDWRIFVAYQIRDDASLEAIRKQCVEIDDEEFRSQGEYILSKQGRDQLRDVLERLRTENIENNKEN